MKIKALLLLPGTLALMLAASSVIPSFTSAVVAAPAHAEGWETQLNLTDAQKAQIKQIHESAEQQINDIYTPEQKAQLQQARQQHQRPNLNMSDDEKAQIKAIRQNADSQMQAVLTSEQQQQLQQLRQQRQQRHQQQ